MLHVLFLKRQAGFSELRAQPGWSTLTRLISPRRQRQLVKQLVVSPFFHSKPRSLNAVKLNLSSASEQDSRNKAPQTQCFGFDFLTAHGGLTGLGSRTAVGDMVWEEHSQGNSEEVLLQV